ncbi:MAG: MarR family transcriptional regulator [Planctomycetia bacterium]|nr:MarR family transcriptional regulator [Planctomycetia bacterium]
MKAAPSTAASIPSAGRHAAAATPAFDSLEQEAYLQLWRTYDRLRELEERTFERHGVTAQQYNALRVLRSVRPRSMATSVLAGRLVSRAPDMTRLLDRLEEAGLVSRERAAVNRRVVQVAITAEGVSLLARLAPDVRRCGRVQLGHLDRRTLRSLIAALRQARRPHEQEDDPWPGNH